MESWNDKARNYQTEWEKLQDKRIEQKNQLAIKAAEASAKGDPHLMSAVLAQSRSFDELEKPIETEWNDGNNILALAQQRTPAADAQLITAMMPYVTGVKSLGGHLRSGHTWTPKIRPMQLLKTEN